MHLALAVVAGIGVMRLARLGIRTSDQPLNTRMMEPVNGRLPTACRCALMGHDTRLHNYSTLRCLV
jgi:hypothetical protein